MSTPKICKFNLLYKQKTEAKNFLWEPPFWHLKNFWKSKKKVVASWSNIIPNIDVWKFFYCKIEDVFKKLNLQILKNLRVTAT